MNKPRHNMLNVIVWAIVACLCTSAFGGTMSSDRYYTWGISGDDLNIPEGSIITEAVLTIQGITNWDNNLHMHIVDNPPLDFVDNVDDGSGDFFQDFGGLLSGYSYDLVDGNLVITFSQINDDENSWVWDIFDDPFNFQTDFSLVPVPYSSSLLELIDYAGNSTPFGIGFDSDTTDYAFYKMTLELTIESYEGQAEQFFLRLTTYGLAEPDPIIVTSPNGGESYLPGSRVVVTWTPGGDLDSGVKIELYKGDTFVYVMASSTANDGNKGRTLSGTLAAGSDYRIKITSVTDAVVYDFSDDYFQIVSQQAEPDPIIVTSPDGGESYLPGSRVVVTWTPGGDLDSGVKIELYKGDTFVYVMASSTANDGNKGRTFPATLSAGSDYRIKITSVADAAVYDFSDGYFTITDAEEPEPDSIVVISPNGGESYLPGSNIIARWTPGGDLNSGVKIELYKGDTLVHLMASSTPNDGNKGRTFPATLSAGSDYRIKITSVADAAVYDFSDGYFTITGAEEPEPDSIVVTLPNGGEVYNLGDTLIARWIPGGDLSSNVKIELYKGNTAVYTIAGGTANDGGKGRILPDTLTAGSDYRIKITSLADESVYDFSDGYFELTGR